MRRIKIVLLAICVMAASIAIPALTQTQVQAAEQYLPVQLIVNGQQPDNLPTPPVIFQERTLVPARAIFEALGAEVEWQEETWTVYIRRDGQEIVVTIGEYDIYVNGYASQMPIPARILNGSTLIPLRAVAENLGLYVDFKDYTVFVATCSSYMPVHPATILSVSIPDETEPQEFVITASSPITDIEETLLPDYRLVLDILNSSTELRDYFAVPEFSSVKGVRAAQFEEGISRIVFDLFEGTEYSVTLSDDQESIIVTIYPNVLSGIDFESGDDYDTLTFSGISPSVLRSQPGQDRITFYLYNTQIPEAELLYVDGELAEYQPTDDEAFEEPLPVAGAFAAYLSLFDQNNHTGAFVIYLNDLTTYTIVEAYPDRTVIRLHETTYRNIRYNFEDRIFRISKADGFVMDTWQIIHSDLYLERRYILELPVNALAHLGYGEKPILDGYLNSVVIEQNLYGNSKLIFNGARIITVGLSEDADYYYIRIMLPREKYPRIVVIDPGHGGRDPGAVRGNILEKDLNLTVSFKLRELLNANGTVRTYMVRDTDVFVSLVDRAQFGNEVGDIFISVHHNAARNNNVHGVETLYFANERDLTRTLTSQNLAQIVQRHLLEQTSRHDRRARSMNLSVLRNSVIPAALVEIGFMSNQAELATLSVPERQWQAARAMYYGILEAFEIYTPAR